VIYVHPFEDNFDDNLFFLSFYLSKQLREKKEERGKEHHVCMRKKIIQKLSQNNCTNIISQT